jgi:alkanesulfonate monooxygenase SsuD/methylene tetrahydromethanopterin reductase-like flavin-dependent oxidoreductase (luciferase family)
VPIYLAAVTSPTIELAGELADGVMPFMWSPKRVAQSKVWIARGRAKVHVRGPLDFAFGIPTFVGDNLEATRNTAGANLTLFTTSTFYQRMFRASGFAEEATKAELGTGGDAYRDRMLDAICLTSATSRCRDQLAAFRAAGADLPILSPPVGVEGAREVIKAFRQSATIKTSAWPRSGATANSRSSRGHIPDFRPDAGPASIWPPKSHAPPPDRGALK